MNLFFPFIYLFDAMRAFFYAVAASFGVLAAANSAQPPFGAISNDLNVSLFLTREPSPICISYTNMVSLNRLSARYLRSKSRRDTICFSA